MHVWDFIWLSSALSFCHKANSTTLCRGGIPPVQAAKGKGARTPVEGFKFIFVCTITQCIMKKRLSFSNLGSFFREFPYSDAWIQLIWKNIIVWFWILISGRDKWWGACVTSHLNKIVHITSNVKGARWCCCMKTLVSRIPEKAFYTSSDLEILKS